MKGVGPSPFRRAPVDSKVSVLNCVVCAKPGIGSPMFAYGKQASDTTIVSRSEP